MPFGFMKGKGTTDAIFIVRQMQEKFRVKGKKLYFGFVDLEKASDRVPREVIRWAMGKLGVEEWLIAAVMVVIAEMEDDLIKRLNEWKDNVENRGMRVNMNKTMVMISGERQKQVQKAVRCMPCGVCGRGVGSNSIQCISCQKWIHKKCSGIKGSVVKVIVIYL